MAEVVKMPKLGFDMAEGKLIRWLVAESETIQKGQVLAEIETDKATVEVEAPAGGRVHKHLVAEDTFVPVGRPIAIIAELDERSARRQLKSRQRLQQRHRRPKACRSPLKKRKPRKPLQPVWRLLQSHAGWHANTAWICTPSQEAARAGAWSRRILRPRWPQPRRPRHREALPPSPRLAPASASRSAGCAGPLAAA